ncbi:probable 2' cyclic ADP-D-ribose synthase BdTIR [Cryptomeria japonica]|uniref:probable 2' cyclic ADP-D-ribose synthase BdTIR n=1 Tax=Cryptomeria japonica TaxID=3369 RepID=UPI0025AC6711|nr:probable 2' cyclic ADP-D-ribose synthase BdTIR [Cryptomeria japonica]
MQNSHATQSSLLSADCMLASTAAKFYKVFINHRGKDTKQSLASSVYHKLESRGFIVFLEIMSLRPGQYIPQAITCAIRSASVHVIILSPNYVESEWFLDELLLIIQTWAQIVPMFWQIRPSDVRMENKNRVYAKAFRKHKQARKFDSRTLQKWKGTLRWVSLLEGFISEG